MGVTYVVLTNAMRRKEIQFGVSLGACGVEIVARCGVLSRAWQHRDSKSFKVSPPLELLDILF